MRGDGTIMIKLTGGAHPGQGTKRAPHVSYSRAHEKHSPFAPAGDYPSAGASTANRVDREVVAVVLAPGPPGGPGPA